MITVKLTCPISSSETPKNRHQSHCSIVSGTVKKAFPPTCMIIIYNYLIKVKQMLAEIADEQYWYRRTKCWSMSYTDADVMRLHNVIEVNSTINQASVMHTTEFLISFHKLGLAVQTIVLIWSVTQAALVTTEAAERFNSPCLQICHFSFNDLY